MSPGSPEAGHRDQPPGEDELWEAVADPSRRKVLDLILAHGQVLGHRLPGEGQSGGQHRRRGLARAGLVEGHRRGRQTRYSVRPERLDAAARAMAAAATRWDRRLHAIRRLAEAEARTRPPEPPARPWHGTSLRTDSQMG